MWVSLYLKILLIYQDWLNFFVEESSKQLQWSVKSIYLFVYLIIYLRVLAALRACVLRSPVFLDSLTRKTGRCAPQPRPSQLLFIPQNKKKYCMPEIRTRAARVTGHRLFQENFFPWDSNMGRLRYVHVIFMYHCATKVTHINFTDLHMLGESQFEEKSGRNRSATTTELKTEDPRHLY